MDKSSAIQILNSRKLITEPGSYQLKVTSSVPYQRPDGGDLVKITNYAAMSPYHLKQAQALFATGEFQEATNNAISSSQRVGRDYEPAKGEIVNVVIDLLPNKEGIDSLFVVSVTALKTSKAASINFAEVEETVEETPLV